MNLQSELEVWIKKKGLAIVLSIGGLNIAIVSVLSAFQSVMDWRPAFAQKLLIPVLLFDFLVAVIACYYLFIKRGGEGAVVDPKPLSELRYTVVPSTVNDVKWAANLAVQVYGGYDVIPEKVMLNWYKANQNGFFVVKRGDGANVGNLDLLALKPNTLREFIGGELLEREILGDCLYGPNEKALVRDIYVESLVVPRQLFDDKSANSSALYEVISKLTDCILNLCEQESVERGEVKVYALSANPVVTKRLVQMGFEIVSPKDKRRDGHDLYCLDFKSLESQLKEYTDRRGAVERLRKSGVSLDAGV
jgi:hypothetical protein